MSGNHRRLQVKEMTVKMDLEKSEILLDSEGESGLFI